MEWFIWPFATLIALIGPVISKKQASNIKAKDKTSTAITSKSRSQSSFYSQIPTTQIRLYQSYIDRAFALSPTLEFGKNDLRFHGLLAEAAQKDALNQIDLELMRMQFVFADKALREEYRSRWAVKVVNRDQGDFFPSPWTILSALFAGQRCCGRPGYGATIQ